jgi:two-component system sensor histidine kinase KdpD
LSGWFVSVALVAAVSGVLGLMEGDPAASTVAALYLFAVLPVAVVWGTGFGVVVAVASTAAYDYLFVPPRHSLVVSDPRNWQRSRRRLWS